MPLRLSRSPPACAARNRPRDGYQGEYVAELAERLSAEGLDPPNSRGLARRGIEAMRERIEATLERFGVRFDSWFSERSLYEDGASSRRSRCSARRGHVYESEGAIWLRTTTFGDDKDRVAERSDGEPTYFAADIAYHRGQAPSGATTA